MKRRNGINYKASEIKGNQVVFGVTEQEKGEKMTW